MRSTKTTYDYWGEMVPDPIRKEFQIPTDALDCLDKQHGSREAALSLFWKIYDLSKNQLLSSLDEEILDRTDDLEQKLNKELEIVNKDATKFFIYLHVAVSLITLALEKDKSYSPENRVAETLRQIEGFWDAGYEKEIGPIDKDDPFDRSVGALLTIGNIELFNLDYNEGKYEDALEHLASAIDASQTSDASFVIWKAGLDPQSPVNAFEKLWDGSQLKPDIVKSWEKLAEYCRQLQSDNMLRERSVDWEGEKQDGFPFWIYAEGLCTTRLSPTEYNKQKRRDDEEASETRLRNYFFGDCWDNIAEEIQSKLKTIDYLWFSPQKMDFGDVVEDLKIVTEQLVRQLLWDPFVQWRNSNDYKRDLEVLKKEIAFEKSLQFLKDTGYEPWLPYYAAMLALPSFKEQFIPQAPFSEDDRKFILNNLAEPLTKLNPKRKKRAHPPPSERKTWQREDVGPLLKQFLGINEEGVLPRLARMLKRASVENTDKQ